MDILRQYIEKRGLSQKAFGDLVGVSQGMVSQWLTGARPISPESAKAIEERTHGAIRRHKLRPDIFSRRAA
jgi:DNA-binding transcriptional regulator YdaS (Cro superfamily)